MKIYKIILVISVIFLFLNCDAPTEPKPDFKSSAGDAIIVNPTSLRKAGLSDLFINTNDTIKLEMNTATKLSENYTISSSDNSIIEVISDSLLIIAKGEEGQTCNIIINDIENDIEKILSATIVSKWADPLYYKLLGSFEDHNYYISTVKDNWEGANGMVDGIYSNGILFVPNSFEEHTQISAWTEREQVWIGLTSAGVNIGKSLSDMFWVNGDAVADSFEPGRRGKLISGGSGVYFYLSENLIYKRDNEKQQKYWIIEVD